MGRRITGQGEAESTALLDNLGVADPLAKVAAEETELDSLLYARHAEIKSFADLEQQRGTPIPALFSSMYKFIQNPSTVSVETFKRMVDTDDTIGSGVDFLTTCLAARIGRYTHPSKEITEWVNKALGEITGGFQNAVKELLGAAWAGFAVQEKVWANDPDLGYVIKKLVSLPPTTVLFETERTGELTPDGILQYQRNYNPANMAFGAAGGLYGFSGGGRPDPYAKMGDLPFPLRSANTFSYLSIRIPVEKCVHYSFDAQGKFGNPYGRSLLRRAYKWWVMKDAFLQMLSVALDRKGTPLTVVFADPNTTLGDASQVAAGNRKGKFEGVRADAAAAKAFANVHNDSTIILPGKRGQIFDLEVIPSSSNAGDFMEAIKMCDRAELRALLVPALIFGNGDGTGSFALGQEHAKTFDKICDGINGGLAETLLHQVVYQLIALNFPASAWRKDGRGSFSKAQLTPDEIAKEIDIIEKAVNTGAVDMNDLNDLNAVRDKLGFEPRTKIIERPDPVVDPNAAPGEGGDPGEGKPDEKKKGADDDGGEEDDA